MKTDPYSALDKPQKHTLRGLTSGRSFTLSAPPPGSVRVSWEIQSDFPFLLIFFQFDKIELCVLYVLWEREFRSETRISMILFLFIYFIFQKVNFVFKPQYHSWISSLLYYLSRHFLTTPSINFVSKNFSVFSIDPDMFVNHYLLIPKPKKQVFFSLKKSKFKSWFSTRPSLFT